jgi:integrase
VDARVREANLAPRTVIYYANAWDLHVSPRIGGLRLRQISVEVCQRFAADLEAAGVGPSTRRKVLMLVGGVLQRAVEWGRIPSNPVRLIRKPTAKRERAVRPLAPATVEAMRRSLLDRQRELDAVLVYAGLRPSEALALQWGDVRERTLLVERALNPDGSAKRTKTGQVRSVRLLAPLREDLLAFRRRAAAAALVFPNRRGEGWDEDDWRNWRARVFTPTAEAAGLIKSRPYDLRHSAASLWRHEGRRSSRSRRGWATAGRWRSRRTCT